MSKLIFLKQGRVIHSSHFETVEKVLKTKMLNSDVVWNKIMELQRIFREQEWCIPTLFKPMSARFHAMD